MPRWIRAAAGLVLLLSLDACGDLPEPFLGNPGATARRLAQPLAPSLAVPPPADMMLPDAASRGLAASLATSLQQAEVPAVARPNRRTDWTLVGHAEQRGGEVVPIFTVRDPQGQDKGNTQGASVPVAAWAAATPATLQQTAVDAAPKIAALLTSIQTAISRADPNSLYNRPAKVMVTEVTGAPGDGNAALTREMRKRLGLLGPVIQDTPVGADFIVQGQVKVVPIPGRQERVEIQWIVKVGPDNERGRVVQLNEIPAGTLDHYWGDVAVVVASEASRGVDNVLQRQSGRDPNDASAGAAAGGAANGAAAGGPQPDARAASGAGAGVAAGAGAAEAGAANAASPSGTNRAGADFGAASPARGAVRPGGV